MDWFDVLFPQMKLRFFTSYLKWHSRSHNEEKNWNVQGQNFQFLNQFMLRLAANFYLALFKNNLWRSCCFFKKGQPKPLFNLFLSFQTNITIFATHKCEKCPSSIRYWGANPRHEEVKEENLKNLFSWKLTIVLLILSHDVGQPL